MLVLYASTFATLHDSRSAKELYSKGAPMKQRISSLDLKLLAQELQKAIEGYRLSNIYNVADSKRQFLLKFNKPDSKINVIVDCGLKVHVTEYTRPTPQLPSGFVAKLRKHLKSKRLTALRQVDNDRILVLEFSDGLYYLVLEFFSAGNVLLLDNNRCIMALQRIVEEHENKVGELYKIFDSTLFKENPDNPLERQFYTEELVREWISSAKDTTSNSNTKGPTDKKKIKVFSIHKLLLSKQPHLSSDLLQKNLKEAGINCASSCLDFVNREQTIVSLLNTTAKEYKQLLQTEFKKGFILAKKNVNYDSLKDKPELEYLYENFHPFKPYISGAEEKSVRILEIEGSYNRTLDVFFSTIESLKYSLRIQNQELQAKKKLEDARSDNQKRIQSLSDVQILNETKANAILNNTDLVDSAKQAVQDLLEQQTDWNMIEKLIMNEKKRRNKIAEIIELPLNLKNNKINIKIPLQSPSQFEEETFSDNESVKSSLSDSDFSDESDSELSDFSMEEVVGRHENTRKIRAKDDKQHVTVTIDLSLSSYANASQYFNSKKDSAEKQKKMEKHMAKAMTNIENRIDQQLKKKLRESHTVLKKIRKPYFFEKYNWFISSEGYLVMTGKSALENDQIYMKYIEDDDIFMSTSFGSKAWIKNPDRGEIPPNTLMQAGIFCASSSKAWSNKVVCSPKWCYARNITKFTQDGSIVAETGEFVLIDEQKQSTLPPAQLIMGIGFLWKLKQDNEDSDRDEDEEADIEEAATVNMGSLKELDDKDASSKNSSEDVDVSDSLEEATGISEEDSTKKSLDNNNSSDPIITDLDPTGDIIKNMKKKVRGKKGKLKKIQRKYADQDEDERLMRLQALGTLKGIEKQQERVQITINKQQEREWKKKKREQQEEFNALQFTSRKIMKINYNFKNQLKPTLSPGDEVVDIVPVFAPWPALLKYKYKVKIQPGSSKKTKSMAAILTYFKGRKVDTWSRDKELDWPKEHDLLNGLKEQELVPILCVDKLNVSIPGSQAKGGGVSNGKGKGGGNRKTKKTINRRTLVI
ncbi:hypothetical protein KAFR_0C03290 [Kazachstania africana CBS 2517]|uniref:Ribosome quality control complex subunit 2 n=1 Tax=Kazachstania africana (strain ATCC 22294 / BCRC 22015 / CBS 2517 / CECT 1963 / NBRC 1671 / NRRL Y-8276) TaxID=1071382 RepID=H2ASH1_KAZAF|nr:hypothetical protein KAFR_0C03290 [Kazachstania africana CBS 2517]CCF57321.1 hypothetical protein KAFR_0C03290 [Kazachstania africana CBS 2517]